MILIDTCPLNLVTKKVVPRRKTARASSLYPRVKK